MDNRIDEQLTNKYQNLDVVVNKSNKFLIDHNPVLAIDFDGTIVGHNYPSIGRIKPNAKLVINKLRSLGFIIIIWSVRDTEDVYAAQDFLRASEIKYDHFNENSTWFWNRLKEDMRFGKAYYEPRKIYADMYIDDRGMGFVDDWLSIYEIVCTKFIGHIPELC